MGENSKIEWTHHTFNPWIGCQKVSAGCDHCYAETQNAFRKWNGGTWGPHAPRKRTSVANWRQPYRWNEEARAAGERRRVFCASLADVFDNQAPTGARCDLFNLIRATPYLDWLLLTKRPENIRAMLPDAMSWGMGWPNVWLGTTTEDQPNYNRRWSELAQIPSARRFISYEPALGPLDLLPPARGLADFPDWVICGGESGTEARPMRPEWARAVRDQCRTLGISYFFKQWGEYLPWSHFNDASIVDDPEQTRFLTHEFENGAWRSVGYPMWCDSTDGNIDVEFCVGRVGKKRAGRLLDGVEHNGFPT